jgi:hypothetical protein
MSDENGLHIRRVSDFTPILTLAGMLVAGLVWGIKLEVQQTTFHASVSKELADERDRLQKLEDKLNNGALQVTLDRIATHQTAIEDLRSEVRSLHSKDSDILDRLVNCEKRSR